MANLWKRALRQIARGAKGVPFAGIGGGTRSLGINEWFGFNRTLSGTDYDYKAEAGAFWENGVVLAATNWIIRRWPEAPQVVYRYSSNPDGLPKKYRQHPLLDIMKQSPYYDHFTLEMGLILSLIVDGNAYVLKLRSASGAVIGFRYIPHFQITPYWPKDGSEFISGYLFAVNGKYYKIAKEDVIHIKHGIDPYNDRKGLSPLSAMLREICTDNENATYSASLMRNMGIPGTIITPKQPLPGGQPMPTDVVEKFKQMLMDKVRDRRGEPFFQGYPVDIHNPGFSPEQMVLDKVQSIPVQRICAAIGIDAMVVGFPSAQKTYSNYKEAIETAYEGCLIPLQSTIDNQMTKDLQNDVVIGLKPKEYLGRDYSNVRCLQQDQDNLYTRLVIVPVWN